MKIIFHPENKKSDDTLSSPKPASGYLPDWFKSMSKYTAGTEQKPTLAKNQKTNLTLKNCPPYLDAMITGYTVALPCDIQVRRVRPQQFEIVWSADIDLIQSHAASQTAGYPSESGTPLNGLKWMAKWGIETPIGYSVLITHPLNRFDLPFRTFSGVVDTDTYHLPVNLPFEMVDHMLPDGGTYTIKEGTPIAQIIPFKREKWESERAEFSETRMQGWFFDLQKIIFKSYKTLYWKKKTYL